MARGSGVHGSGQTPLINEWTWPWGVAGVLVIALLWLILPGGGGAGWLWLPLAFVYGIVISWRTWMPGRPLMNRSGR